MQHPCAEGGSSKSNTDNRSSVLQDCLPEHTPKLQSREAFRTRGITLLVKNSKLSLREREIRSHRPQSVHLSYGRKKEAPSAPPSIHNLKLVSFQSLRHRQEASKRPIGYVSPKIPVRRRRIVDPRFVALLLVTLLLSSVGARATGHKAPVFGLLD